MISFKRIKGRKAQEVMMLKVAVDIIIAALAISLLLYLGCKFFQIDDEERAAIKYFHGLSNQIDFILGNSDDFASIAYTYYLPHGYTLVGFDKIWKANPAYPDSETGSGRHSRIDNEGPLLKPSDCWDGSEEKACLCIYKGNIHERYEDGSADAGNPDENIVECRLFEGDIVFIGNFFGTMTGSENGGEQRPDIVEQEIYKKISVDPSRYEYLQLYSGATELRDWLPVGDIYVEKYDPKDTDKIYIFMTKLDRRAKARYTYFNVPCPEGSMEACRTDTDFANYLEEPISAVECIATPYISDPALADDFKNICADIDDDKLCEVICVLDCEDGLIDYPCLCEGFYRNSGICYDNKYLDIEVDCSALGDSCENYCKVGPQQSGVGETECVGEEKYLCEANPCGFSPGCTVDSDISGGMIADIDYYCK